MILIKNKKEYISSQHASFTEEDNEYIKEIKTVLAKSSPDRKHREIWITIYKHSMAKLSKSHAERCCAPHPLPDEVDNKLNDQIEISRDLLLKMLFRQDQISDAA
jgi:hypothetical protein